MKIIKFTFWTIEVKGAQLGWRALSQASQRENCPSSLGAT